MIDQVRLALTLASLAITTASIARTQATIPPQVVAANCSGCHELRGNSQTPYIPRLAGLSESYLKERLQTFVTSRLPHVDEAFHLRRPKNTPAEALMLGMSHAVSSADLAVAARWYAGEKPVRRKAGNLQPAETGEVFYAKGSASQGVQPCQTCHGVHGDGTAEAPRLAGQSAWYLREQLRNFRDGCRASAVMSKAARNLDDKEARAVSLYLQSQ